MKVEVEKQPDSVSMLRIELPPEEVSKERDEIAGSFARLAKIPGYRPGKAPRRVIEAKFRKEIQEELTKKLVSKSYRDAIEEKQLRVVSLTNVEDVQFGEDKSMRFCATVVTATEFDLVDYNNFSVVVTEINVSTAGVDAVMDSESDTDVDFLDYHHRVLDRVAI